MASLLPIAHAAFSSSAEVAQEALQSYIDRNPISTVSAAQSQATATDLESVKAAMMAGNFTSSRSWEFLRNPCPGSCTSLGIESSGWPVYSSVDHLSRCDETMLLDFALYTDINGAAGQVKIRGCTADLYTDSTSFGNSSCKAPEKSKTVTTSLQLGWDAGTATGSTSEAVASLEQLLAYETMNPYPCNETINFAYSGKTSVGIYMGSALHRQGLLTSILKDLIDRVEQEGVTETTVVQLCDSRTSRYSMGIIINSNEDLLATQMAVQSWRDTSCLDMPDNTIAWNNLTYSVPVVSNSTSHWTRRDTGVRLLLAKIRVLRSRSSTMIHVPRWLPSAVSLPRSFLLITPVLRCARLYLLDSGSVALLGRLQTTRPLQTPMIIVTRTRCKKATPVLY